MVPSVGRIVHYFPGKHDIAAKVNGNGDNDPVAAVVVRAWVDGHPNPERASINIRLLLDSCDGGGTPVRTSVIHREVAVTSDSSFRNCGFKT